MAADKEPGFFDQRNTKVSEEPAEITLNVGAGQTLVVDGVEYKVTRSQQVYVNQVATDVPVDPE